jgi:hypothetical protein
MSLVLDNRAGVTDAGVHVFIVGVSDYLNLPAHDDPPVEPKWFLNKLTSAAISAFKIYELIRQTSLRLPLKTIRLLLSPSELETRAEPAIRELGVPTASRTAFENCARAWREDAKSNPADMTIFYFAGHGIQRGPEDGVLLLDDFLADGPPLAKCFAIGDIRNGMAPSPSYPDIALSQFYFVDACLTRHQTQTRFVNPQVPDVFGAELNVVDRREATMIFSTVDGAVSLGRTGMPSHFSAALTLAFERAAENPQETSGGTVWPVTSLTIKNALDMYYKKHQLGQVKLGGVVGLPVIRYLTAPPEVDISVEVRPPCLEASGEIWLLDETDTAVAGCDPTTKTQFEVTAKAGIYRLQVESELLVRAYRSKRAFITQSGPKPWMHDLTSSMRSVF